MKKGKGLVLVLALMAMCLAGCGTLKVDHSTVYVQKNGKIEGATVEALDRDYYNAEELESYVEEQVAAYTSQNGEKSVKIKKFSTENGTARLNIRYAGYEDYAAFNQVVLFSGTVPQAMAADYDFNMEFVAVTDGVMGADVAAADIMSQDGMKVVILSEKIDVKVDGTIQYVSKNYTTVTAKDTVSIIMPEDAIDGQELALVYIIYK